MAAGKGSKKKRPPAGRTGGAPASKRGGGERAAGAGAPAGAKGAPAATPPDAGRARTKPTRTERLEAARRARRRKATAIRAGLAGAVVVLAGVVAASAIGDRRAEDEDRQRLTAGSCTYDTEHDPLTVDNHVPPARYEVDPPAGGDHDPASVPAGFYSDRPTTPPDAQLVHSLEHGLVVVWHQPDLTEAELADLRAVFDEDDQDVVVVPRPSLDLKVAATSWERRLRCGEVEQNTLSEFVDLYRNQSPEPGVR